MINGVLAVHDSNARLEVLTTNKSVYIDDSRRQIELGYEEQSIYGASDAKSF